MNQIIKTFMAIFFICSMAIIGMGLISASIDAYHADQYISNVVNVIEKSDFANAVVNDCLSQATAQGYELSIKPLDTNQDDAVDIAEIQLKYQYTISSLDAVGQKRVIRAYAR